MAADDERSALCATPSRFSAIKPGMARIASNLYRPALIESARRHAPQGDVTRGRVGGLAGGFPLGGIANGLCGFSVFCSGIFFVCGGCTAVEADYATAPIDQLSQREFPSAASEPTPMSGFFTGLIIAEGILVLAAVCFFWLPPLVLFVSLGLIVGPLMGLTMRCGACPNCGRKVQIMSAAVSASKCPSCKHRLEIRDKRIVDLT